MVEAQRWLIDALGIPSLFVRHRRKHGRHAGAPVDRVLPGPHPERHHPGSHGAVSAQSIALNEVPRQAIYADPNWNEGDYYGKEPPNAGLAVARMIGHITYLSETSMREKFGRRLQERERYGYDFATEFEVESYLKYHGNGSRPASTPTRSSTSPRRSTTSTCRWAAAASPRRSPTCGPSFWS